MATSPHQLPDKVCELFADALAQLEDAAAVATAGQVPTLQLDRAARLARQLRARGKKIDALAAQILAIAATPASGKRS